MVAPVTSFAIARQLLDVQREAGAMIIGVRSYADAAVRARSSLGVLYFCFLFFFYTTRNGWLFLTSAIKRFFIFSIYFFHLFFFLLPSFFLASLQIGRGSFCSCRASDLTKIRSIIQKQQLHCQRRRLYNKI